MIWTAGWLIALYGAAHLAGALAVEGAARHAGAWLTGALWHEDLAAMSPAGSAYWLSWASFGVPLILLGLLILWLDRRNLAPPAFMGWALGLWTLLDAAVLPLTPWPVLLLACVLLLVGARRAGSGIELAP